MRLIGEDSAGLGDDRKDDLGLSQSEWDLGEKDGELAC